MLRRGVHVRGRVVDHAGKVIADAVVWAVRTSEWVSDPDPFLDGVRTGADGSFDLAGVARGTHAIHALAAGYAPNATAPLLLDGDLDGVVVKLDRGKRVAGRAVHPDRRPATTATVRVSWSGGFHIAQVDSEGRFWIDALPAYSVWIVARDHDASSKPRKVALDQVTVTEATALELVLDNAGVIAGIVVDRSGAPIEGAQVSARRLDASAQAALARPELTDAAGRFDLRGLPTGDYRLAAARDPRELERAEEVSSVVTSTGNTEVRLVLESDGAIEGRVAFRSGGAPATYSVRLGRNGVPAMFTKEQFKLAARPGRHALWIEGPGFTATSVDGLDVKPDAITDAGTTLLDRGRVLRGRVIDPSGSAAAGADVTAGAVLSGTGARADVGDDGGGFRSDVKRATTAADGSFQIEGATASQLSLVAVSSTGRSAPISIPAGNDDVSGIELSLNREGRLSGVVSVAGKPTRAIVNAQSHAAPLAMMIVVTSDGAYQYDHLAPGRYSVAAVLGDPYAGSPLYPRTVDVKAGATTTLDLPVTPGSGSVTVHTPGVTSGLVLVTTQPGTATAALPLLFELGRQSSGQWAIAPVRDGRAVFQNLATGQIRACVVRMPGVPERDTSALFERMVRSGPSLGATCAVGPSDGTITLSTR